MCLPHHLSNYCTSPPIHLLSTWLHTSLPTSPDACTHIIMPLFLFIIFCCIYLSYTVQVDLTIAVVMPEQPQEYWVKEFLTESDKLRITKGRGMDAKVVHAAQTLLKGAYPHIKGLQDSLLAQTLEFEIWRGRFVQVFNMSESNWITVSNINYKPGVIAVYMQLQ